jgi:hypothetical protein
LHVGFPLPEPFMKLTRKAFHDISWLHGLDFNISLYHLTIGRISHQILRIQGLWELRCLGEVNCIGDLIENHQSVLWGFNSRWRMQCQAKTCTLELNWRHCWKLVDFSTAQY